MLSYLSVKNYAILANIDVEFDAGMTALTGETGAGKSLLIDAIGLLLGDRATDSVVRSGEEHCLVSGLFVGLPNAVTATLDALGIPHEDGELLIEREISTTSQNRIKLNRKPATLADLRSVTRMLADIHTQHDTKRLINPDTYLDLIDRYDKSIPESLAHYHEKKRVYDDAIKRYKTLIADREQAVEKRDFYRYHIDEIDKHNLKKGEESTLEQRINELENFDRLYQSVREAEAELKEHDALERIFTAAKALKGLSDVSDTYRQLADRIESAYYELDDVKDAVATARAGLDFDPDELERLQTRQHELETLKRKHRKTVDELIAYRAELADAIDTFDNMDALIGEAETALNNAFEATKSAALALREARKTAAKAIEKQLIDVLDGLELKGTRFNVIFEDTMETDAQRAANWFTDRGVDSIDFHVSTNVGEPLKPLARVASGGELSRIMLALKTIFLERVPVSLMIFDEIDTGVSGYVASQVAKQMRRIAERAQVLAITHLPQVAARGDRHHLIVKTVDGGRTNARIEKLDREGRVRALAAMISSGEITKTALKSAEELLA